MAKLLYVSINFEFKMSKIETNMN